ncbi:hypothetical protein REPUB_Repub18cG0038100 [Reevesia pubescens]
MASLISLQSLTSLKQLPVSSSHCLSSRYVVAAALLKSIVLSRSTKNQKKNQKRSLTIVAAVGDVSANSTNYLFAGVAAIALVGTAFPILFAHKDT